MVFVDVPDRIELPPPPERISPPAAPVIGDLDLEDDLSQAPTLGTVAVWFFIDAEGRVVRTLVNESSGYDELDEAALRVAGRLRFSPAWNRDRRVPVWVSLPITFQVR